jgi:hypothetical protein
MEGNLFTERAWSYSRFGGHAWSRRCLCLGPAPQFGEERLDRSSPSIASMPTAGGPHLAVREVPFDQSAACAELANDYTERRHCLYSPGILG